MNTSLDFLDAHGVEWSGAREEDITAEYEVSDFKMPSDIARTLQDFYNLCPKFVQSKGDMW